MSSLSVYISLLKKVFLLRCYNNFRRGYFNILADKWPNASWSERKKMYWHLCKNTRFLITGVLLPMRNQLAKCFAKPFISIWFQEEGIKDLFQGYMNCKRCIQTSFLVYIYWDAKTATFFCNFFSFAKKKILGINFCLVIFDSCHYYLAKLCVLLSK